MNDYSEDFKGVWFPRNLWLDTSISLIEKGILVVIKNLDKGDDHCWATNNYLAEFLQCSVPTITRAVAHLKQLWYVEELSEWKTWVCRKLRVMIDITDYPNQNDYTPNQNDEGTLIKMIRHPNQNDEGVSSKWLPNSIYNNIYNNNIGEQKNFSNADASPSSEWDGKTELDSETKKAKRITKKQQRRNEIVTSSEFNTTLLDWITNEVEQEEIKTLWSEYVELRCSKDYRALTDWAVKRNLKVLEWTTFPERKTILEKSITKWRTWLFPLNEFDMKRIEWDLAKIEWSDERLYDKIFSTKCKEKEDELPEWTTHDLLMDLVQRFWEGKVKKIYYERVRPKIEEIYGIKRDWVK